MLFNSFTFFLFLGLVLPLFYWLPSKLTKNSWLLLASYVFYGFWDWRFCGLLATSSIADFYIGQRLYNANSSIKRKNWLLGSLTINLGILGFFKYFNFFTESFIQLASKVGVQPDALHLNVILPVGISFYTFQTLSYTIDIYRQKIKPTKNFIDFALFVAFFPQLVAGPIERASNLLPQLSKKLTPSKTQLQEGVSLVISGLFRKVMLGDTAGRLVDHLFANPAGYRSSELICGLLLFSIQIYADFSGYSHMARGLAKLLGVELMKNFTQPYLSVNITEFWRRWHISLSTWLRDYLYIPLGGNRKGSTRTYFNLMITMLLGGLWHGANWTFIVWGLFHGVLLAGHKALPKVPEFSNAKQLHPFRMAGTYLLVLIGWLIFRAPDLQTLTTFAHKIIYWEASPFTLRFATLTASFMVVTFTIDTLERRHGHNFLMQVKQPALRYGVLTGMILLVAFYLLQATPTPFIYFQF